MKTIIKYFKISVCIFSLMGSTYTSATISNTLQDPLISATVNNWSIPNSSVQIFHFYASARNEVLTESELLQNIIENRLIAEHARNTLSLDLISDETKVGFKQYVAIEDQLVNILKFKYNQLITQSISQLKDGKLTSIIIEPLTISKADLAKQLSMARRMEYKLTALQEKTIRDTVLITYQFPQKEQKKITLWDIYERTNIQEKISLFKADIYSLKSLIQRRISTLYTLYWVKHHSGLKEDDIVALKDFVADNRVTRQYYSYIGAASGVHKSNNKLRELSKKVSSKEIETYYSSHKEEFRTVIKVKARHISLPSQAQADRVYQELKSGLEFSQAIQKYSMADDKNAANPGDLGWIMRSAKKRDWLHTLPFTQKKIGQFSPPFMSPKKDYAQTRWEIIYLDERIQGYLDIDSKTVRYKASKVIAAQQIATSLAQTKQTLFSRAHINLNTKRVNSDLFNDHRSDFDLFERKHRHNQDGHGH